METNPFNSARHSLTEIQQQLAEQADEIGELNEDPDYGKLANALLFARSAADRLAMRYARRHPTS